jgi:hypothetical protein
MQGMKMLSCQDLDMARAPACSAVSLAVTCMHANVLELTVPEQSKDIASSSSRFSTCMA